MLPKVQCSAIIVYYPLTAPSAPRTFPPSHVRAPYSNPLHRQRRSLLHLSPRPFRTYRRSRPPTYPAQPRSPLRYPAGRLAAAVYPPRTASQLPANPHPGHPLARGRAGSATHRRAIARPPGVDRTRTDQRRCRARVRARRCRFPGVAATTQRRRRAGCLVGHAAGATDPALATAGTERSPTRRRGRLDHRSHGRARLGTRHLSLAVWAQRARRVAGSGLPDHEHDAAVPRRRRPGAQPAADRRASV